MHVTKASRSESWRISMSTLLLDDNVRTKLLQETTVVRRHSLEHGAEVQSDGSVRFKFWAPAAKSVHLELEDMQSVIALESRDNGWQELVTNQAAAGSRYKFVLPDGTRVPDPASRFQPFDIHGPSEVVDPTSFRWQDVEWKGREWNEAVLYELHVGAFTDEGTFLAAI